MVTRAKLTIEEIPELPGYVPVARVAEKYGVNKGAIYHLIYNAQAFHHVYKVSRGGKDQRPLLLLLSSEVDQVFARKDYVAADDPGLALKVREWNKRVKQWGRDTGWTETPIRDTGRPNTVLEEAFLKANPAEPRPGSE